MTPGSRACQGVTRTAGNWPSAKFWCDLLPVTPYSGRPLKVIWPLILPNSPPC